MPLPLFALFLAAFVFGTTEFVIAGILPDVAQGLGVSIPFAGYLVSGYALGIAIGGPLLTMATRQVSRRTILIALTIAFCLGQVACALAPDFATMLLFRVATAIAHGAYFGIAMVVAVGLVPQAFRGRAVAVILAGLTVSNIIGVPIGAAIGGLWGWRTTFWAMTSVGVLALAAIWTLIPSTKTEVQPSGHLSREVRVLGRQQVWTSLLIVLALMIGQMVPFTYITPLLREVTGLDAMLIPWVLLLNGVGATLGVLLGGRLSDWKLMPSLIVMLAIQAAILVVLYLVSPYPLLMTATIFIWGALNFAIGAPVQARILMWTADAPSLASSLIPSGFNIGIAIAAVVGAALLEGGYGYRSLPVLGAVALALACVVAILSAAHEKRVGAMPPAAVFT
ncbi:MULTISPECIES: MFS transporter [unclassified Rhizobium]|uniref:MFS transporter n=1 Tax=unclassified Rhizobium TaxID=2613769 RepID=UPI000EA8533E|nr:MULTISPECIES: MFS transporter [unclassified Rhizobium]AYG68685.1 MFS transporter [Rhizobium sp. CCGE531]AYG75071.1 MFS transporter [Rhizobium sp. CCGE532]